MDFLKGWSEWNINVQLYRLKLVHDFDVLFVVQQVLDHHK